MFLYCKILNPSFNLRRFDKRYQSAQLEAIAAGRPSSFSVGSDGILRLGGRVCVPSVPELRRMILEEGHRSKLSIHPGATKMY